MSAPRRVLMTADAVGGVWHYALTLARELAARDIRVLLAVMGPPPNARQRIEARGIAGLELAEAGFRLEWMADCAGDLREASDWLLRLTRAWKPDLIHLNGYAHAALPWPAPCLSVAHSCVLTWWRAVHGADAPPRWNDYAQRVRSGLASASLVVAPTAAFLAALQEVYGALPRRTVIRNGIAPEGFVTGPKEMIGFSAGRLWDEAKNLALLDAAAERLEMPIYVAGEASAPDGGRRGARHVRTLGLLDTREMRRWLGWSAVFALPARYEPFGLAALEAARSGCALVLGDIPTLRELWDGAAEFVPPDDRAALHETLRALSRNPRRTERLGAAALARSAAYDARRMGDEYIAAYAALLQEGARPAAA